MESNKGQSSKISITIATTCRMDVNTTSTRWTICYSTVKQASLQRCTARVPRRLTWAILLANVRPSRSNSEDQRLLISESKNLDRLIRWALHRIREYGSPTGGFTHPAAVESFGTKCTNSITGVRIRKRKYGHCTRSKVTRLSIYTTNALHCIIPYDISRSNVARSRRTSYDGRSWQQ